MHYTSASTRGANAQHILINIKDPFTGRLETSTHVVRRTMFPVERLGDEHLPEDGVDVENLVGGLICSHPGDAVSDRDVLVLVRADLRDRRET